MQKLKVYHLDANDIFLYGDWYVKTKTKLEAIERFVEHYRERIVERVELDEEQEDWKDLAEGKVLEEH